MRIKKNGKVINLTERDIKDIKQKIINGTKYQSYYLKEQTQGGS